MLSTIRLVFFFLHFKFLSWHSSCPFQVSRDSSLITHGSSLMAHHSWLITHGSSLMAHHSWLITHDSLLMAHHSSLKAHHSSLIMTPGSPHDSWFTSWLLVPLLTPGSPHDSWLLFYFILIYEGICSFIFCYLEKPRGNSDRLFFTFWQKTWWTPDRPFFTF